MEEPTNNNNDDSPPLEEEENGTNLLPVSGYVGRWFLLCGF